MKPSKNLRTAFFAVAASCALILLALSSGCMGIQLPQMPQNMMKMNVPVQSNPVVISTPGNPIQVNASNVTAANVTTVTPKPVPKYVYV